jgi:hypothetical protein
MILLDHAFEMLLKAGLIHRGGSIRDRDAVNTIGFSTCVNRARSNGNLKFLDDNQATTINVINAVRDAAQHHIIDLSEEQLYLHIQSGVTLYRNLMETVFGVDLAEVLPNRVLPISTVAFTSIEAFFDAKVAEIQKMLQPGKRRRQEAIAALRPIAILDRALREQEGQPTEAELQRMALALRDSGEWRILFEEVALLECSTSVEGYRINLHLTKKDGLPIHRVDDGDSVSGGLATKMIDISSVYNLTPKMMAKHLGITPPKFTALSRYLGLEHNEKWFRLIRFGKQEYKRFSPNGLQYAKAEANKLTPELWNEIWQVHGPNRRQQGN